MWRCDNGTRTALAIQSVALGSITVNLDARRNLCTGWEDLLQMADPAARDAQLRKIGNYKFEQFESIPLFYVNIEVVVDPKIIEDWPFSGWDGGDLGHTWLLKACKQEKPCR
jgi:hypothetical protein